MEIPEHKEYYPRSVSIGIEMLWASWICFWISVILPKIIYKQPILTFRALISPVVTSSVVAFFILMTHKRHNWARIAIITWFIAHLVIYMPNNIKSWLSLNFTLFGFIILTDIATYLFKITGIYYLIKGESNAWFKEIN